MCDWKRFTASSSFASQTGSFASSRARKSSAASLRRSSRTGFPLASGPRGLAMRGHPPEAVARRLWPEVGHADFFPFLRIELPRVVRRRLAFHRGGSDAHAKSDRRHAADGAGVEGPYHVGGHSVVDNSTESLIRVESNLADNEHASNSWRAT